MSPLALIFLENMDVVFFIYGLSFFCMGLAVLLEAGRSSEYDFARGLFPLAFFGLVHGGHEWFEMFLLAHPEISNAAESAWISYLRVILLAISFFFLVVFGAIMVTGLNRKRSLYIVIGAIILIWLGGLVFVLANIPIVLDRLVAADVYTRYALAIPGAVLTAFGLLLQRQKFMLSNLRSFGKDIAIAAIAFLLYGIIGQLFASPSAIFPSNFLNTQVFIQWFGIPVQVFRAIMATIVAIAIIHSLRAFEVENQRRLEALQNEKMEEHLKLDIMRAELLHRTVQAQEAERQRIARELHDSTGQTLTGLGMGLRALSISITADQQKAAHQARRLEKLTANGIEELQRMVGGLHPPQLDELGLMAALRWYVGEISQHTDQKIQISGKGNDCGLPQVVRTVFYRIAQETITNAIRHAQCSNILVELLCDPEVVILKVEDDGCGYDPQSILNDTTQPHWGLLGMQERAELIQANLAIESRTGSGTMVMLEWPRSTQ
jgi:signal transduction histidine kinase